MAKLEGRVAILTGAAGGIGRVYTRRLLEEGARVALADLDEARTRAVAEAAAPDSAALPRTLSLAVDVTSEDSTRQMVERALAAFGRVDVLVNNAALFSTLEHRPFDQIPVDEWDRVMAVNLKGLFLCSRAVLPPMRAQGSGRIINIGSGILLNPLPNFLHYVTSKGGVFAFTRALSRELGPAGITVNTLAPGLTITEGVREHHSEAEISRGRASRSIQRDQLPEDLLGALIFLASDDSAFITGQMLSVNGGAAFW